jgi:hypothetical protein
MEEDIVYGLDQIVAKNLPAQIMRTQSYVRIRMFNSRVYRWRRAIALS